MKRYKAYKDSGVKWIGKIPSHWRCVPFRRIAKVQCNLVHPWDNLEMRQISPDSIEKNSGKIIKERTVEEANLDSDNHRFYKGQILYSKIRPLLNKVTIAPYDGLCSADMYPISTIENTEFIMYYMLSASFLTSVKNCVADRVKMPKINQEELKETTFVVPPLHEQQAIVDYLKDKTLKIEQYVSARERERELLDNLKQSEIANIVTKGLNPNVKMKDSGIPWIGEIPEHWKPYRNKDIFEESKKIVGENSSDYVLLSLTKQGVIVRDLSENKGKFPKEFNTYKVVEPGDMIFCMFDVDETPRTVGLSQNFGMITGAYDVFKIKRVLSKFALYYYLSIDDRKALRPLYKGLRKVVPLPTFMSSKIFLPPLSEQQAIVAYIDEKLQKIDQYMTDLQREIDYLKEFKQRLISDAVTGQLCVTKQ